jgi:hypothetical protein
MPFALATVTNTRWLKSCLFAIVQAHKPNGLARVDIRADNGSAILFIGFTEMLQPLLGSLHPSTFNCVAVVSVSGSPLKIVCSVIEMVTIKVVDN